MTADVCHLNGVEGALCGMHRREVVASIDVEWVGAHLAGRGPSFAATLCRECVEELDPPLDLPEVPGQLDLFDEAAQ